MYKVNHKRLSSERRVTTTTGMMSKTDQLQMFGDRAWYAKQVPGYYKPDYVSHSNFKSHSITVVTL